MMPKKIIFIYNNKGGVGKSTVCVNLAYSLQMHGFSVSIFDADINGPNIIDMVNSIKEKDPEFSSNLSIKPGIYAGVKINSIGSFSNKEECVYWKGKYLDGLLYQLLFSVEWNSDILLIDMPPGSGEIHNKIFSKLKGKAVLVSTPQSLTYNDTIKAINMLHRTGTDILGFIENMSFFLCSNCGKKEKIFRYDSVKKLVKSGLPLIGRIPLHYEMDNHSSLGVPYVLKNKDSEIYKIFMEMADKLVNNYNKNVCIRPVM